jgi:phenylacetate-CoA ligase
VGRLVSLYARLPVWAQHAAFSAYGLYWYWYRFGPGWRRFAAEYAERDRYDARQWNDWRQQQLREVLRDAAEQVPYYRRTWTRGEKAAALAGRLEEVPLLDKDPLRADPWDFVREDWHPRFVRSWPTSGSTGTPIASIWTVAEMRRSLAVREIRSARWAGVSFGRPRATFHGRMVVPDPHSQGPFYRYNLVERQVYLSPFHLRPATVGQYVEALDRHRIEWLTGYAVAYYLMARLMLEQRIRPPGSLKAVVTTSEKVTPAMRAVMQEAFGCRVFEEYSTVENAVFASECEHGRLHVSPEVAVVEILRPDGSPCGPGEPGEVVATGMLRRYQPFIRYRLGDVACWDPTPCPCGRAMPVIKDVLGRIEDVVIGPDGRRIAQFYGIFADQPHVREGQIVQETTDRIRVRVVPAAGFGPDDVRDVIARMKQRLGVEMAVSVETVEEIPRSRSGKFQAVVSRLHEAGVREAERTGVVE